MNRIMKEITYINIAPGNVPKKGRLYLYINPSQPLPVSNKYKIVQ